MTVGRNLSEILEGMGNVWEGGVGDLGEYELETEVDKNIPDYPPS